MRFFQKRIQPWGIWDPRHGCWITPCVPGRRCRAAFPCWSEMIRNDQRWSEMSLMISFFSVLFVPLCSFFSVSFFLSIPVSFSFPDYFDCCGTMRPWLSWFTNQIAAEPSSQLCSAEVKIERQVFRTKSGIGTSVSPFHDNLSYKTMLPEKPWHLSGSLCNHYSD